MDNSVYDYYITPEEYEEARKNGINKNTLDSRIRIMCWNKSRAITEKPHKKSNRFPKNIIDLANSNGICYRTLLDRVNRMGLSMEDAATIPLKDSKKNLRKQPFIKYSDEIFKIAESNGISKELVRHRLRYKGNRKWTIEEAITIPPMTHRQIGLLTKEKTRNKLECLFVKNKFKKTKNNI